MFKKIVNDEIEILKKRQFELYKEREELNKSIMEKKIYVAKKERYYLF